MKNTLYIVFAIVFTGILFSYSSGTPSGGRTDAPNDVGNCSSCHSGSNVLSADWISTNIPASGYTPGTSYIITATGNHTGAMKFGFELTAEDLSGKIGTFEITNPTETKLAHNNTSVTHTSSGNSAPNGEKTWSFNWTAPDTGTGDVTFYGAFNAANGNSAASGDVIYTSELAVSESTVGIKESTSSKITIAPNPANDLVIINSNELINTLNLFNTSGELVLGVSNIYAKEKRLDLTKLAKGIYFIQINNGNNLKISKLIIE